jgi:hypothetical protein
MHPCRGVWPNRILTPVAFEGDYERAGLKQILRYAKAHDVEFSGRYDLRKPPRLNIWTHTWSNQTGELGFEPRLADPESAVLPLHHSPKSFASTTYEIRLVTDLTKYHSES